MSTDGIGPNDPTAFSSIFQFKPNPGNVNQPGQQGSGTNPSSLNGDSRSTNSGTNPLYSLESSLLKIVNQQAPLDHLEDKVDLAPFLQLLQETTDGHAGADDLEKDLKSFLASEDSKSETSGNGLSGEQFDADIQSFLQSEKKKYDDQDS